MSVEHPEHLTEISARRPRRDIERERAHRLLTMLETHGIREGEMLDEYRRVAEGSEADEAVRYLVQFIMEDEHRHHGVMEEMANALRSYIWQVDLAPRSPTMGTAPGPGLLDATRQLLAYERADERELRHLRRALHGLPADSIEPLLVKMIQFDTAKHIAILEFITQRLSAH